MESCNTIIQVCVYIRVCFGEESKYCFVVLLKHLVLMISVSPYTVVQGWTIHLLNPLSFCGGSRDIGFDGVVAEVYVENACVLEVGVM